MADAVTQRCRHFLLIQAHKPRPTSCKTDFTALHDDQKLIIKHAVILYTVDKLVHS